MIARGLCFREGFASPKFEGNANDQAISGQCDPVPSTFKANFARAAADA